jgi:hypothetical protein
MAEPHKAGGYKDRIERGEDFERESDNEYEKSLS